MPQDIASLIHFLGGPEAFVSRLDFLHSSGLTDIGNEPSFLTVFMYHYAGRPALSSLRAHSYIPSQFNGLFPSFHHLSFSLHPPNPKTQGPIKVGAYAQIDSTAGLPGNDDTGAMASFTAFCMMGLFPNPGQNVYFITAPFFEVRHSLDSFLFYIPHQHSDPPPLPTSSSHLVNILTPSLVPKLHEPPKQQNLNNPQHQLRPYLPKYLHPERNIERTAI